MDVYGLTGGIGSGKSAVAELLEEYGIPVVSADELSRMVVAKGSDGMQDVVEAFGTDVLDDNGELDRKAMGRIVFGDADKRRQLEAILHPRIRERYEQVLDALEKGGHRVVVYEVPLLFEKNLQGDMKAVVLVTSGENTRIARVRARDGLSADEIRARIAAQMSDEDKLKKADYIIYNDASLDDLRREVEQLISRFLKFPPRDHAAPGVETAPAGPPSSERTHVGPAPSERQSLTRTLPPGDPSVPAPASPQSATPAAATPPPPPATPAPAPAAAVPPAPATPAPAPAAAVPPAPAPATAPAAPPPPPAKNAVAARPSSPPRTGTKAPPPNPNSLGAANPTRPPPPPAPAAPAAAPAAAAPAPNAPPPPAGASPSAPLPPRPRRSTMAYPPKPPAAPKAAKPSHAPKPPRKDDAGNESESGS